MDSPFEVVAANDSSDYILPFNFDNMPVRGRLVTLEHTASTITGHHPYPPAVASLLAQALAATAGLASLTGGEQGFTLQASGDGFVDMLLCDLAAGGNMRGYARFRPQQGGFGSAIPELLGEGYLAFTAERDGERYQGIVPLEQPTLEKCIEQYFAHSAQIGSYVRLAAARTADGGFRAAALYLQHMPAEDSVDHDDWQRMAMLLQTLDETELLFGAQEGALLLQRLFAEDDVRVFPIEPLRAQCRCSQQRILEALATLPKKDLVEMAQEGDAAVSCEFCNREYVITAKKLQELSERV